MPSFPSMPSWLPSQYSLRRESYAPLLQNSSQDEVDSEMQADFEKAPAPRRRLPRRLFLCLGATFSIVIIGSAALRGRDLFHLDSFTTETDSSRPAFAPAVASGCTWNGLPCRPVPLASHEPLMRDDGRALEAWIADGIIPSGTVDLSAHDSIDGVWLWVNGSDPRHQVSRSYFGTNNHDVLPEPSKQKLTSAQEGAVLSSIDGAVQNKVLKNIDKRFRENDELKYSLRGALHNVVSLRTAHVISPDYWPAGLAGELPTPHLDLNGYKMNSDSFSIEQSKGRQGQLPQWLDQHHSGVAVGQDAENPDSKARVRFHHDWSVFQPLRSVSANTQSLPSASMSEKELLEWKEAHLPTFNSNAAESFLGINLKGLSDALFYSNDDMFFSAPLDTADFFSPLYGPVLHMQQDYSFFGSRNPSGHGDEAASQRFAAHLINQRFGLQRVHYPAHVQKSLTRPHMLESRLIWGDDIEKSNKGRFRGSTMPINTHILSNGLLIERHREALLWGFFVARMDKDGDGVYSDAEFAALEQELGRSDPSLRVRSVDIPIRDTVRTEVINSQLEDVKFSRPLQNIYDFSSMDGVYSIASTRHASGWPSFTPFSKVEEDRMSRGASCHMRYDSCMRDHARDPSHRRNVDDVFRYFAFENRVCGDCAIAYLVGQSGKQGLSAFLPDKESVFPSSVSENPSAPPDTPPHLSLSRTHTNATFTLAAVADHTGRRPGDALRPFVTQLLHRYNYVIARAPASFEMLRNPTNARDIFKKLDSQKQAFICLNDDIEEKRDEVLTLMSQWFKKTFPQKLPFERA